MGRKSAIINTLTQARNFMTPLQTQQSLDLTFDDAGAFDVNSEILAFTNLDDSIIIDPSRVYANYQLHQ